MIHTWPDGTVSIVEFLKNGIRIDGLVVERDPTPEEARAEIGRAMVELQRSGEAASAREALKMALDQLPLHAKVYCAS